jgi:hypothetical protein
VHPVIRKIINNFSEDELMEHKDFYEKEVERQHESDYQRRFEDSK